MPRDKPNELASWLDDEEIILRGLKWCQDEVGWHWNAHAWKNDKCLGLVGTYYDLRDNGMRPTRECQEKELQTWNCRVITKTILCFAGEEYLLE